MSAYYTFGQRNSMRLQAMMIQIGSPSSTDIVELRSGDLGWWLSYPSVVSLVVCRAYGGLKSATLSGKFRVGPHGAWRGFRLQSTEATGLSGLISMQRTVVITVNEKAFNFHATPPVNSVVN